MKVFAAYLIAMIALSLAACGGGSVKEADEFVAVRDDVTAAWAKEVDTNPTESGIDNMRKIFDSKKADLIAKKEAFMKVSDKASEKAWSKLSGANSTERTLKQALLIKFGTQPEPVQAKLRALLDDYYKTVEIPNLI